LSKNKKGGKMKVDIKWMNKMLFKSVGKRNRYVTMDTVPDVGGQDSSLSPKEMILTGLGGCTGMDVISILRKMKQVPDRFEIEVEAKTEKEFPKEFKSFKLIYKFWGKNLDEKKMEKAVTLSQDKYCGVSETLKKAAKLDYEIIINEK